jgi:hypothetical protein
VLKELIDNQGYKDLLYNLELVLSKEMVDDIQEYLDISCNLLWVLVQDKE